MNIDQLFDEVVGTRTSLSRLEVGRAESIGVAGFGVAGFTVRGFESDGNDALVHIRGVQAGLSVLKLLKIDGASVSFQWEVRSENLNVLFGRPGRNDFDRMVGRTAFVLTDSPADAASIRGLFFWIDTPAAELISVLLGNGAKDARGVLDNLLRPSESWAVIELKGAGLPPATLLQGASTQV